MHAVKVLKATIEGSVDKSVRAPAAAKFASDKPDVGRPVSVLHTKKISLTEDSPEVYTQKNISLIERVTRSHTKDLSLTEQHESATKRQARNKESTTSTLYKEQELRHNWRTQNTTSK